VKRRLKAGHRRALARLERCIIHWRCPACLDDARPVATMDGLRCPFCGSVDARTRVFIWRMTTRAGFQWVAVVVDSKESCAIG
jgi:hypothetical protein